MANQIRKIRKERDVTIEALADRTGLSTSYLSRIEGDKRGLSLENAVKIAKALSVEVQAITDEFSEEEMFLAERALQDWQHKQNTEAGHRDLRGLGQKLVPEWGTAGVYGPNGYKPRMAGLVPEIDVQAGAGEGEVGEVLNLPLGGESYSGHKIIGEWLFPEEFLRAEIHASASQTLVMPVKGDSMEPTYRPGDRVLVDLSQKTLTEDTVYIISDGQSAPRIKRLVEVLFSDPRTVTIVSDNPTITDQTVPLADLTIIGRVVGVVSRR